MSDSPFALERPGSFFFLSAQIVLSVTHGCQCSALGSPEKLNRSRSLLRLGPVQIQPRWSEPGTDVQAGRGSKPPTETQSVL